MNRSAPLNSLALVGLGLALLGDVDSGHRLETDVVDRPPPALFRGLVGATGGTEAALASPSGRFHNGESSIQSSSQGRLNPKASLPPAVVERLLEKLESDDEFRGLFVAHPRKALELAGLASASVGSGVTSGPWEGLRVSSALASKEVISATRQTIRNQLLAECGAKDPINLQA